jgi:hypothetical protein
MRLMLTLQNCFCYREIILKILFYFKLTLTVDSHAQKLFQIYLKRFVNMLQIPEYAKDAILSMSTHFKTKPATHTIPQLQIGNLMLSRMSGKKFICYGIHPAPAGDERAMFIACNIDPQNPQFMLPGSLLHITTSGKTDKIVKYLGGFPYTGKTMSHAAVHSTIVVEAITTGKITTYPIHNFTRVESYVPTMEEAMAAYTKCPLVLPRKVRKDLNDTKAIPNAAPTAAPTATSNERVDDMSDTDSDDDVDDDVDAVQIPDRVFECIQKKRKHSSLMPCESRMVSHSTSESKRQKHAKILFEEIEELKCRRDIINDDIQQRTKKLYSICM